MKYVVILLILTAASVFFITTNKNASPITPSDQIITTPTTASPTESPTLSRYVPYSSSEFEKAKDQKRVYFFHASWCPTCKAANIEFTENARDIPTDVVVFKTNYDTEKALKAQYAITYQHTFVLVDGDGKEVKKWNGGSISELLENTN